MTQPQTKSHYIPLVGFEKFYEIRDIAPYTIRNIKTKRVIHPVQRSDIYQVLHLRKGTQDYVVKLHRLLAKQFIPNPDPVNKIFVDHINHARNDNRLENLRWTTRSENNANLSSLRGKRLNYIHELPEYAYQITNYNNYEFSRVWFDPVEKKIYYDLEVNYRELTQSLKGEVQARDVNGIRRHISIRKLEEG